MPTKVKTPDPERIASITVGTLAGDRKLANSIKELIVNKMRNGFLPSGKRIKKLKKTTVELRRKLAEINKTHPDFSPKKSNLTFSGQFLDSFKAIFERVGRVVQIKISPTGINKGGKNLDRTRKRGISNEKIGEFQIALGRDYRPISNKKKAEIKKLVVKRLRKKLKL